MQCARARLCLAQTGCATARLAGPAASGQWRWMALSGCHLFKGGPLPSGGGSICSLSQQPLLSLIVLLASLLYKVRRRRRPSGSDVSLNLIKLTWDTAVQQRRRWGWRWMWYTHTCTHTPMHTHNMGINTGVNTHACVRYLTFSGNCTLFGYFFCFLLNDFTILLPTLEKSARFGLRSVTKIQVLLK